MTKMITVFTPTYNRAEALNKCYESLCGQTSKDFVWMVVDDGSVDNTKEVVQAWIAENKICIVYIYKENGGKVSSINLSLEKCETELWVCLDSDDYLTPKAIEVMIANNQIIKSNPDVCGLLALRTGPDGKVMNNKGRIPEDIVYASLQKIRYELNIDTEYVFVYKSAIIKQYPYPVIPGEKFFALSYVYDQVDLKYKYRILQDDLMVSEYLEDGITRNKIKLIKHNPKGYIMLKRQCIEIAPTLFRKIKSVILYGVGCLIDKDTNFTTCIKNSPAKFFSLCLLPVTWLVYMKRFR